MVDEMFLQVELGVVLFPLDLQHIMLCFPNDLVPLPIPKVVLLKGKEDSLTVTVDNGCLGRGHEGGLLHNV